MRSCSDSACFSRPSRMHCSLRAYSRLLSRVRHTAAPKMISLLWVGTRGCQMGLAGNDRGLIFGTGQAFRVSFYWWWGCGCPPRSPWTCIAIRRLRKCPHCASRLPSRIKPNKLYFNYLVEGGAKRGEREEGGRVNADGVL
jgi:hypothetical protein